MAASPSPSSWTAVILAGGRASRLGGVSKPQLLVGGRPLLSHVIDALPQQVPAVVVGPEQDVSRSVTFCREQPEFGGPVAALAAALPWVSTPAVGVVAADMPGGGVLLRRLALMWSGEAALVPMDVAGVPQPLCSLLSTRCVATAIDELGDPEGQSMRRLLQLLEVTYIPLDSEQSRLLRDIDDDADLESWRDC